jgi:hypothetical protein
MSFDTAVIFDKIVFVLCCLNGVVNQPTLLFHFDVVGLLPDSPKNEINESFYVMWSRELTVLDYQCGRTFSMSSARCTSQENQLEW